VELCEEMCGNTANVVGRAGLVFKA